MSSGSRVSEPLRRMEFSSGSKRERTVPGSWGLRVQSVGELLRGFRGEVLLEREGKKKKKGEMGLADAREEKRRKEEKTSSSCLVWCAQPGEDKTRERGETTQTVNKMKSEV